MNYTKKEVIDALHESKEESQLKTYLKDLSVIGEDFACRSLIVKPDIINSMREFSTQEIESTSDEIAIYMIKAALLTRNPSSRVIQIRELMIRNAPLEGIIDSILISKQDTLELARNVYYQKDTSAYESFTSLYKDEASGNSIVACIMRLNKYLKEKKEKDNQAILSIEQRKYVKSSSQEVFKKTA